MGCWRWSFYTLMGLAALVTIPLDLATAPFQAVYFLTTDSWRLGP